MTKSISFFILIVVFTSTFFTSPVTATTWHIPGDAATIKAGISMALAGDTVLVACGTYNEYNIRLKSGVILRSETGQANCVTIDAQQQDRVMFCRAVNSSTRIEGFTITGGLIDEGMDPNGGGIYCIENSSPTFVNCAITGNEAGSNGGGVYIDISSPTFLGCSITGNSAPNGPAGICIVGSYFLPSEATLIDCTISGNDGQGVTSLHSHTVLNHCSITGNTSYGVYGNVVENFTGSLTLIDCTLSANSAWRAAGIHVWRCPISLTNCTVSNNTADNEGGGLYAIASSVTLTGCSFTGNTCNYGGAVYLKSQNGNSYLSADSTTFSNNTAMSEGNHGYVEGGCSATLRCCDTDLAYWAGSGNVDLDNDGCITATESTTWGRVKSLYQ